VRISEKLGCLVVLGEGNFKTTSKRNWDVLF
jgi:hypothetical protein